MRWDVWSPSRMVSDSEAEAEMTPNSERLSYRVEISRRAPRHPAEPGLGEWGDEASGVAEACTLLEATTAPTTAASTVFDVDTFNRVWQAVLNVHRSWLRPCPR